MARAMTRVNMTRPRANKRVSFDYPGPPDYDLDCSFNFGFSESSCSAADYVPRSLENSPETSPNSTVRGSTGRRRFQCGADYFAAPTPPLSRFNRRGHEYTASDASSITLTPENVARHGHRYTASDSSDDTICPDSLARHGHRHTASDASSITLTPENLARHGHRYTGSDANDDTISQENVTRHGHGYTESDASDDTMSPGNLARHGHRYTASDTSSPAIAPEDVARHTYTAPDPVTPRDARHSPRAARALEDYVRALDDDARSGPRSARALENYFRALDGDDRSGPSSARTLEDFVRALGDDARSDSISAIAFDDDEEAELDLTGSSFVEVEGNIEFSWPTIPCRPKYRSLALPHVPLTKSPVFGPPVRTCRCCTPDTSPELLSAELAQEGNIMGPQLDALRSKLNLLISSMNMTVEIGGAKLLESIGTFLNLARVIVNEFDQIATKFSVRWEHRLTPVPPPGPPRYFREFEENELMAGLPPGIAPASETVNDRDFCCFWQHCAWGFSGFRIGDATDVLIANDFVQLTFNHFRELKVRMRRDLYQRARLAVRDAKLAQERKDRKDVRRVPVVKKKKRIDEEETIGDDTVEVEGDDAVQMQIRTDQIAADAEADEMKRRWDRRQNANGGRGM